jgi:hypothetical protein
MFASAIVIFVARRRLPVKITPHIQLLGTPSEAYLEHMLPASLNLTLSGQAFSASTGITSCRDVFLAQPEIGWHSGPYKNPQFNEFWHLNPYK